jgi:Tol biopolymer transport system component
LLATRFDESRLAASGQAVPIADGVITNLSGGAHYDLSPSGTLAYVPGTIGESDRELAWVTLDGKATPALAVHGMGRLWSLSPDGMRVVWNNTSGASRDIFVQDLARGTSTRVTSSGYAFTPIWSPDGKSVIFERGVPDSILYRRRLDGSEVAEDQLASGKNIQYPSSVSPDGGTLTYTQYDPVTGSDIWVRSLAKGAQAREFVKSKFSEGNAMFSPDGRWLAYQSNESGRFEINVRSFPDGARTVQATTDGGLVPMWSSTGREIYYRGTDNLMKVVSVEISPEFHASKPRVLFDASKYENVFGVAPDGKRLLMMPLIPNEQSATQIHLVLNFLSELRQRVK